MAAASSSSTLALARNLSLTLPAWLCKLSFSLRSLDFSKDTIVWDNTYDNNAQAIEDVTNTAQIIRAEGNYNEQELENGLKDSGEPGGYDIRDIGGRIRMYQDDKGYYQFIDGRTKSRLMK